MASSISGNFACYYLPLSDSNSSSSDYGPSFCSQHVSDNGYQVCSQTHFLSVLHIRNSKR
jgi:hypothetical protein